MILHDARVVLTGGSGFIGSHLARACVREGAQVTCLLRPGSNPWRLFDAADKIRRVEVDLTQTEAVQAIVSEIQPHVIFHLAADTNRKRDLSLYPRMHATHVLSTLNLVSAALKLSLLPRFIHTGTIEEYGRGPVPYREDQREDPVTPYSLTKHEATRLVLYAAREHGLPAIVIRPSLTYGPTKGKGMFIPDFIRAALTTKVFDMSPGEQTRDFIFVEDVVRAHLAAATADGISNEIFNAATGVETRLKDAAEALRALFGGDVQINYGAYPCDPRVETMRCFMDIQKSKERLGWEPAVSLHEGLAKTVAWYRDEAGPYEELLWK